MDDLNATIETADFIWRLAKYAWKVGQFVIRSLIVGHNPLDEYIQNIYYICMPTIAVIGKIKIMIYFDDHGHPHVHAVGPGAEAKILISTGAVIRSRGFSQKELGHLVSFITLNKDLLLEAWNDAQK